MSHQFEVSVGKTLTLRTAGKYCEEDIEVECVFAGGNWQGSLVGTNWANDEQVFYGRIFFDRKGEAHVGTFTIDPELTEQYTLLAKLAKAVRYKAAGNIDLDPELTEQDALISDILTTLARKLPSKT